MHACAPLRGDEKKPACKQVCPPHQTALLKLSRRANRPGHPTTYQHVDIDRREQACPRHHVTVLVYGRYANRHASALMFQCGDTADLPTGMTALECGIAAYTEGMCTGMLVPPSGMLQHDR